MEPRFHPARWRGGVPILAVATILAALPLLVFPRGTGPLPPTGPYGVARALFTLTDASRTETYGTAGGHRRVTVGLWYPDAQSGTRSGGHPLVVFSHGGLGVLDSNESLYLELASHGFVVAAIGHTYQAIFVVDDAGARTWIDLGYLGDLRREDAKTDKEASLALYRQWMAVRTADIELVIDWLTGVEPADGAVVAARALVDGSRIGLIGHSLGGSAALGVGRARAREGGVAGGDGAAGADGAGGERAVGAVAAVIALEAPLLADIVGVAGGEFVIDAAPYPVPVLSVYTDDTWGRLAELPQYAGNVALLGRQDAQVSNVHIAGARHLGLTDLALTSPLLTRLLGSGSQTAGAREVLGEVNRLALGFLSTHLGGVDAD